MNEPDGQTLGSPVPEPEAGANRNPTGRDAADAPMTEPQRNYLDTLARQAGEEISAGITQAEASEHIDRLQQHSNRVTGGAEAGRAEPDGPAADGAEKQVGG